jgi:hypothetical protein
MPVLISNPSSQFPVTLPPAFFQRSIGPREGIVVTDELSAVLDAIDGLPLDAETIGVGGGDVSGPVSSTDNAVVRWNGTSGNLIQDSTAIVSDTGELAVTSTGLTPTALSVVANSLTSGALLSLASSSGSATARTLATVTNTGAAANTTLLSLVQNGIGAVALSVSGRVAVSAVDTTTTVFRATGNALTTGALARFESSSDSVLTRNLVEIANTDAAAVGATLLDIANTSTGRALSVSGAALSGNVAVIAGDDITTGSALRVESSSSSGSERAVLNVVNSDVAATSAVALAVNQLSSAIAAQISAVGTALSAVSTTDTGTIATVTGDDLTTGSLALFYSESASVSARDLVRIVNNDSDAIEARGLAVLQESVEAGIYVEANGKGIEVLADNSSQAALEVRSPSQTTGPVARFIGGSISDATRDVVTIENLFGDATGTTALNISQLADQVALNVSGNNIATNTVAVDADNLETGRALLVSSNSADIGTRVLAEIVNDSLFATGTTVLRLSQEAAQTSLDLAGTGGGSIQFQEASDHPGGAPPDGKGKIWVRNDVPNVLIFTSDDGTDTVLGAGGGGGDVNGPSSATDNALVRFDSTTGKLIQNSTAILSDAGQLTVTSTATTGYAVDAVASLIETGGVLRALSNSADVSERALALIHNQNVLAVGATALHIQQDAAAPAIFVSTASTTTNALTLTANALSTGRGLLVQSSSSSGSVRNLMEVSNSNVGSIDTTLLRLSQSSPGRGIYLTTATTLAHAVEVEATALTSGDVLRLTSSSTSVTGRSVINAANTEATATATPVVTLTQASIQPSIELLLNASIRFSEVNLVPQLPGTAKGTLWVRDDVPNVLVFTNDNGDDVVLSGVGGGDVTGPSGATDNALVRFDSTTGKLIQDSAAILADSGALALVSSAATVSALSVVADALTTASGLSVLSNSSETDTRSLVSIINDHASSAGTTALSIRQDATQLSIDLDGTAAIRLQERATVPIGNVGGKGILWIRSDTPNVLIFTNDDGTDTVLGAGGGSGDVVGPSSATDNAITRFDSTTGKLIQNSTSTITDAGELSLVSTGTTGYAATAVANSLTTGGLLLAQSNSAETDARALVAIQNLNVAAVGAIAVDIVQASTNSALFINAASTSNPALRLITNALTTGSALQISSSSASASVRNLVSVVNSNAGSIDTTAFLLDQGSPGRGLYVTAASTTNNAAEIATTALTSGNALAVSSSSDSVSGRSVISATNSSADASACPVLLLNQASTSPAVDILTNATIRFSELANIPAVPGAGKGSVWVRNSTPSVLIFTNDEGTDVVLSGVGGGDVSGPSSATANAITRFDGTGGKTIKNSSAILNDIGATTGIVLDIAGADSLTSGSIVNLNSNSSNADTERALLMVTNDNSAAVMAVPIVAKQDADGIAIDLQGAPSTIRFVETTGAPGGVPGGAPGAGRGKYWVDGEAPNVPMFTGDTGVDSILSNNGAQLYETGLSQVFSSTTPTKIVGSASTFSQYGLMFDNGGSDNMRIRYVGARTRNVKFYWSVGVRQEPASGSVGCFICQLYKNGSLVVGSDSRSIVFAAAGSSSCGEFFVSAVQNDYFELFGFRLDALADAATQNVLFNAELL